LVRYFKAYLVRAMMIIQELVFVVFLCLFSLSSVLGLEIDENGYIAFCPCMGKLIHTKVTNTQIIIRGVLF
jgi:hypothetical protein